MCKRNGDKEVADRWQVVLDVVSKQLQQKYKPGRSDCFITGLRVADAISGSNLSKQYAGVYKSRKTGEEYMQRMGFYSLADLLATHFEKTTPATMQWGDLGVVVTEDGEHVAVCMGSVFIVKNSVGQSNFSLSQVEAGFKVS